MVRRPLRDRSQRGRHRRRPQWSQAAERGVPNPLRRPPRGAQGPAVPAHRLRRPGRPGPGPADRDRCQRSRASPLPPRPGADGLDRGPRACLRGGAVAGASRRRRALRPVAVRRELRHGPDGGLRRRHAGDRLGDRRLQRRGHRRPRRGPRPTGRPAAAGRGAAARPARSRAPPRNGRSGADQRRALRLAAGRRPGERGVREGDRGARPGERRGADRPPRRDRPRRRPPAAPCRAPALPRPAPGSKWKPAPQRRPAPRPRRRRGPRPRSHGAGGEQDRRRPGRLQHRPLRPQLGADRLRADVGLALLPGRFLVLDRQSRSAQPARCAAAMSPRRR